MKVLRVPCSVFRDGRIETNTKSPRSQSRRYLCSWDGAAKDKPTECIEQRRAELVRGRGRFPFRQTLQFHTQPRRYSTTTAACSANQVAHLRHPSR